MFSLSGTPWFVQLLFGVNIVNLFFTLLVIGYVLYILASRPSVPNTKQSEPILVGEKEPNSEKAADTNPKNDLPGSDDETAILHPRWHLIATCVVVLAGCIFTTTASGLEIADIILYVNYMAGVPDLRSSPWIYDANIQILRARLSYTFAFCMDATLWLYFVGLVAVERQFVLRPATGWARFWDWFFGMGLLLMLAIWMASWDIVVVGESSTNLLRPFHDLNWPTALSLNIFLYAWVVVLTVAHLCCVAAKTKTRSAKKQLKGTKKCEAEAFNQFALPIFFVQFIVMILFAAHFAIAISRVFNDYTSRTEGYDLYRVVKLLTEKLGFVLGFAVMARSAHSVSYCQDLVSS